MIIHEVRPDGITVTLHGAEAHAIRDLQEIPEGVLKEFLKQRYRYYGHDRTTWFILQKLSKKLDDAITQQRTINRLIDNYAKEVMQDKTS